MYLEWCTLAVPHFSPCVALRFVCVLPLKYSSWGRVCAISSWHAWRRDKGNAWRKEKGGRFPAWRKRNQTSGRQTGRAEVQSQSRLFLSCNTHAHRNAVKKKSCIYKYIYSHLPTPHEYVRVSVCVLLFCTFFLKTRCLESRVVAGDDLIYHNYSGFHGEKKHAWPTAKSYAVISFPFLLTSEQLQEPHMIFY